MLRVIKRKARQFVDIVRFYGSGKLKTAYAPKRVNLLSGTWNGDYDILGTMLLKTEHMFWSLKKYGYHEWSYVSSEDFLDNAPDSYILEEFRRVIEDNETIETLNELPFGKCLKKFYIGRKDEINCWIQYVSYNGKEEWYYCDENKNYEKIDVSSLTLDDEHGSFVIKGVIKNLWAIKIPPEKYKLLGKKNRGKIRGQRQTLIELLELRRMIRKLMTLDSLDEKYYSIWADEKRSELTPEKIQQSEELYRADRKKLYSKIAKLMAEKGDTWWD